MKLRHGYLGLCVIGAVLPYSQFIPWVATHGLDFPLFFQELFSTRISGFFALDVIVSAAVLFTFVLSEGRRLELSNLWLPILATILVGVSLGFPSSCTCGSGNLIKRRRDNLRGGSRDSRSFIRQAVAARVDLIRFDFTLRSRQRRRL